MNNLLKYRFEIGFNSKLIKEKFFDYSSKICTHRPSLSL